MIFYEIQLQRYHLSNTVLVCVSLYVKESSRQELIASVSTVLSVRFSLHYILRFYDSVRNILPLCHKIFLTEFTANFRQIYGKFVTSHIFAVNKLGTTYGTIYDV